jgi:NADH-quinone oxidoreductase subunit L
VLRLPEAAHAAAVHSVGIEFLFTCLSVAIALIGIFFAYRFYVVNPEVPGRIANRLGGLYALVSRKYYVDELYDAAFVNRTKDLGNACYFIDAKFVDGAVNGTAATTRGTATVSRLFDKYVVDGLVNLVGWINMALNRLATSLQTGMVQRYALGAVVGILVVLLIYYNELFRL